MMYVPINVAFVCQKSIQFCEVRSQACHCEWVMKVNEQGREQNAKSKKQGVGPRVGFTKGS